MHRRELKAYPSLSAQRNSRPGRVQWRIAGRLAVPRATQPAGGFEIGPFQAPGHHGDDDAVGGERAAHDLDDEQLGLSAEILDRTVPALDGTTAVAPDKDLGRTRHPPRRWLRPLPG